MNDDVNDRLPDETLPRERSTPLAARLLPWKMGFPIMLVLSLVDVPLHYRNMVLDGVPDIGDPFDVEEFGTVDIRDIDNARVDYEKAMWSMAKPRLLPGQDFSAELSSALDDGWHYASPLIRTWLDDNRPALKQWMLGTEKFEYLENQPREVKYDTLLNVVQELRMLASLAQLEISRLLREDNPDEAWLWARAAYISSRHLGQRGVVIERLVGIAIHVKIVNSMMDIAQHPQTSDELLKEMLEEIHYQYGTTARNSTILKCDYLMWMNSLRDEKTLNSFVDSLNLKPFERIRFEIYRENNIEPGVSQRVCQHYFANLLEQVDLPPKDRQPRHGDTVLFERDAKKDYPADLLEPAALERAMSKTSLALLLTHYHAFDRNCVREACRQRACELCLALRIYFLRHGVYPVNLEALVTAEIISEVPIDVYSRKGENMLYRTAADEAFVWSVGENGIDDGGGGELDAENFDRRVIDVGYILGREKDDGVEAKRP